MSARRVVVTGTGMLSPLGSDVAQNWEAVQAGRSGISLVERFDTEGFSSRIGGAVRNLNAEDYLPAKELRKLDAFIHYGLIASFQAIAESGLTDTPGLDPDRVGVAIGSGIGGLEFIEKSVHTLTGQGPRRVSPFFVPASVINMIAGNLAI